ncbi:metallophosphoesterase [Geofilum sp. OHC36d9]|uniref:metallophosphoesterase n=1 Tax=Geofilum sp. OHC36d9 TaxID=3458413 RepID=UPI004034AA6C
MISKIQSFIKCRREKIVISRYEKLDIIGDIHGYHKELVALLEKMDYTKINGVWQHPTRKAIFVGDMVSRGPATSDVLKLIRQMVDNQSAMAVLGNHELNMIGHFTTKKNGRSYLILAPSNKNQMETIRKQFGNDEELYDYVKWLRTLPFMIDFGRIRVAHAYWSPENQKILSSSITGGKISRSQLKEIFKHETPFAEAVWQTTRGIEINLPNDMIIKDAQNLRRANFRIKWWEKPEGQTFRTISYGNRFVLPEYTIPPEIIKPFEVYQNNNPIMIFGHYCAAKEPMVVSDNLCCIDSCVASSKGKLSAYRWNGEKKINSDHIIQVDRF